MKSEELLFKVGPSRETSETAESLPGFSVQSEVESGVFNPSINIKLDNSVVLFLIVNKVVTSIGIDFAGKSSGDRRLEDLMQGTGGITLGGFNLKLRGTRIRNRDSKSSE